MSAKFDSKYIFIIAATYIGTIVGAGFASGQEILQFFGYFGSWGLWGVITAAILFSYFGVIILKLGAKLNAVSHREVVYYVSGKWGGTLVDYIVSFFLFGGLAAMLAGAGAIFAENYHLPFWLGSVLMLVLTVWTVLGGFNEVISSISIIVPLLLGAVLLMGLISLFSHFPLPLPGSNYLHLAVYPHWLIMCVLYVSYNIALSVTILSALGGKIRDEQMLAKGGILGGIGLGIGALAVLISIFSYFTAVLNKSVPLLYVAGQISPLFSHIFVFILLAEIYTTAVSSLYGFTTRVIKKADKSYKLKIICLAMFAFLGSLLGFVNLVRFLYPLVGVAGLILLVGLGRYHLRGKEQ